MKISRKTVCRICFAVIVVITFIWWGISLAESWKSCLTDDIFGTTFVIPFYCGLLLTVLVYEHVFYLCAKYLFVNTATKTVKKTVFCITVFLVNLVFAIRTAMYVL